MDKTKQLLEEFYGNIPDDVDKYALANFVYEQTKKDLTDKAKFSSEWDVAEQVETYEVEVIKNGINGVCTIQHSVDSFKPGDKVIVQIRKKEE